MSLTLITAPTTVPLSLQEVKAGLRLDASDESEDALLAGLIRSSVAQIDGRDGWLGRQLCAATWRLDLPEFPCVIKVPLPPLQEVTEITYIDASGVEQTLDPAAYHVAGSDPAMIVPTYGTVWPATRCQPDAARITFVAGYGGFNDVPEDVREGLLLLIRAAYDQCHSEAAINLLYRYRAW
jgi:uncharacterized phiE125 gp8 family phage protein